MLALFLAGFGGAASIVHCLARSSIRDPEWCCMTDPPMTPQAAITNSFRTLRDIFLERGQTKAIVASTRFYMHTSHRSRRFACCAVVAMMLAACSSSCSSAPPPTPTLVLMSSSPEAPNANLVALEAMDSRAEVNAPDPGTAIPVTSEDPMWGNPLAPVTMVMWSDFECPFCGKLEHKTIPELKGHYGPNQLRIVWKHNPLPFHKNAVPTALAAETVFRLGGSAAFWKFHSLAFGNQRELGMVSFVDWAAECGVDPKTFSAAYAQEEFAADITNDMALGKKVGVSGTPASFINGVYLGGAQKIEKFEAIIDEQLKLAANLRHEGVPERKIYAQLSEANIKNPPAPSPPPPPPPPPPPDTTVYNVPIDGSPVHGKNTALVTIVEFADYQCPFCQRVTPTIYGLEKKYGDKLRIVFKHNPLPMHPQAEPAAQLAIEALAQKGEAGFWKVHEALFAQAGKLEEADLLALAVAFGLDTKRVKKSLDSHAHASRIDKDQNLADDLQASGTPHFFINGRRLVGAQPSEKFEALIDEEMANAEKMVASGTAAEKVYDAIIKNGKAPVPPERILAPAPTADNPSKGPKNARVVIQMFADFECPYCKRSQETIAQVLAKYPKDVRVVWRHKPLPFHHGAQLAAEASVEAFRQKGDAGFWAFSAKLFEAQSPGVAIDPNVIEQLGRDAGLDVAKLSAALNARTHWKTVQADAELADRMGISGTPGFVVNDYFISGAQPFPRFKKFIELSLGPHIPIDPTRLHGDGRQPAPLSITTPPPLFVVPNPNSLPPAPPSSTLQQNGQLGAKHLVVMYAGSMRAPTNITRTKAEALQRVTEARQKLINGSSFGDIVTQYSDEPGAAHRGGDLGTFPKGVMVPEFQQGVENTPVGSISGIVETPFGYHIILRTK